MDVLHLALTTSPALATLSWHMYIALRSPPLSFTMGRETETRPYYHAPRRYSRMASGYSQ